MSEFQPVIVPLYPQTYPVVIPPDQVPISVVGNINSVNNIHYPTLDVYVPKLPAGQGVVICPGGGYSGLAIDHEGRQIAQWLNSLGVSAFVLKYRLPPKYRHPVPMQDVQRAMRLVRANAANWGVKTDRVGIMGFSAGGHLASTAATHYDLGNAAAADAVERWSCRPDFLILGYPVVCFSREYCHAGTRSNLIGETLPADLAQLLSNELHVTPDTPPTFIFHSSDDPAVDVRNALDFYLACQQNKVSAELHVFPAGGHGYGMGQPGSAQSQWPGLCARWLQTLG